MLQEAGGSIVPRWGAAVLRPTDAGSEAEVMTDSQKWLSHCSASAWLGFLLGFRYAFFENAKGEVGLLFVDQERRREADGVCARAKD